MSWVIQGLSRECMVISWHGIYSLEIVSRVCVHISAASSVSSGNMSSNGKSPIAAFRPSMSPSLYFHIYLAPGGGCEVLFSPGLSVYLSVCLSACLCVCPCVRPIFWYFISRLLEEISIWNLYRILIGLYSVHWQKGHRDGTLLFEGTVISQKLSHRIISIFFHRYLLGYSIRWNNTNLSEQRNDVTKNTSIFDQNY